MKTRHFALLVLAMFLVGGIALWRVSVAPDHRRRTRPIPRQVVLPRVEKIVTVQDESVVIDAGGIHATIGPKATTLRDPAGEIGWGAAEIEGLASEAARLHRDGETAIVDRGSFVESFENRADGIEHSIVVRRAPAGELRVHIPVSVEVTSGIDRVFLGDRFEYRGIRAWDADGKELIAKLGAAERAVVLQVDAAQAAYPVTIDPVLTTPAPWASTGENAGNSWFGISVASAGDVNNDGYSDVLVGAPNFGSNTNWKGKGKAYLFLGTKNGLESTWAWTSQGEGVAEALYGLKVSSAGDVDGDGYCDFMVAAPFINKVYIYKGAPKEQISQTPAWTRDATEGKFGWSMGSLGDVNGDGKADIAIGTKESNKAFVYYGPDLKKVAGTFTEIAGPANSLFGRYVSGAGDVNGDGLSDLLVAAPGKKEVHLYFGVKSTTENGNGTVNTSSPWVISNLIAGGGIEYAHPLASAGDVNGDGYSDIVVSSAGSVSLYYGKPEKTPFESQIPLTLSASSIPPLPSDYWSTYIMAGPGDFNGDGYADLLVAVPYRQHPTQGYTVGSVQCHFGSANGLSIAPAWERWGEAVNGGFGFECASAGDVNGDGLSDFVVGVPGGGKAYVYHGSGAGSVDGAGWSSMGHEKAQAKFGSSVAPAGDVDGDGYADFLVGAPDFNTPMLDGAGRAYLYKGGPSAATTVKMWQGDGGTANGRFGHAVASAGDVDGDGKSDFVVAEPGAKKVHVFKGPVQENSSPWVTLTGSATDFGYSVACAGDLDGDGLTEILVGSPMEDKVYVYKGSSAGPVPFTPASLAGPSGTKFGFSVSSAGHVNNDAFSDIIVGAPGHESSKGKTYVYHGPNLQLKWSHSGDAAASAQFGYSVAHAGDVNGDGLSDVIVGAPGQQKVFVFRGEEQELSSSTAWAITLPQSDGQSVGPKFGYAVALAGDVNGDGLSDLVVTAPLFDTTTATDQGKIYVYLGSPSGPVTPAFWTCTKPEAQTLDTGFQFGFSAACAGDVNGDGNPDLVVGTPFLDTGSDDVGKAYLFYGNGGGVSARPRQVRSNGDSFQLLGRSGNGDSVKLRLVARSHGGRTKVRVQWEVKPHGTKFDGTGLGESQGWTDTGLQGTDLTATVGGLEVDKLHHWRLRVKAFSHEYGRWFSAGPNGWNEADFRTGSVVTTPPPDTTAPSAPTNLTASAISTTQINLSWNASTDNVGVTAYKIWRNSSLIATVPTLSYGNAGLAPSTSYAYQVKAVDAAGNLSAFSNEATAATPAPADTNAPNTSISQAPPSLTNATSATFTFSATEAGCTFERSLDGGNWIAATSPETLTGLSDGSHTYQVRAKDAAGNLDASPAAHSWSVDATPPSAPSNIAYNPNPSTTGSVNVHWGEGGYDGNGSGVSKYDVRRVSDGTIVPVSEDQGAAYLIVSGLPNGSHIFQVRCTDAAGNVGPWSTNANAVVVSIPTPDTQAPSTPANLTASVVSTTKINLSWTASTDNVGVTGYKVWRNGSPIASIPATSYSDGGLVASTTYAYQVKAVDAAGNESAPASASAATLAPDDTTPPAAPTGISAGPNPNNSGTHTISWNAVSDAAKYDVWVSANNQTTWVLAATVQTTNWKHAVPVGPGTYAYKVRAVDAAGNVGPFSSVCFVVVHPALSIASLSVGPSPTGGTHSIQWTVQGAVKQSVLRSANGGAFQEVVSDLSGGTTSVTIGDSIAEGSYVYKILAIDYEGNQQSATSASLLVDKTPPNPPAAVNWSFNANGAVVLTWGAGSDAGAYQSGLKSYLIRRKPAGGEWVVLSWKIGLGKKAAGKWTDAPPAGTYYYSVASRDKVGLVGAFGSDVGPIAVGNPPPGLSITTPTLPGASVGLNFNVVLTISGGTAPYTYSIVSGALPPGLVLSGGTISGSPTQVGSYSFTIKIADSAGQSATQAFTLVVVGAASTLKIKTNAVLPVATAGLTYAHIFEAEGGVAPFKWEIASGVLPGSWTLSSSDGLLSGSGVMGTMLLSIKVTDSSVPSQTVQKDFTLLIEATPSSLAIVSPYPVEDGAIELPAAMAANAYSTTFVAAVATGWSVSSGKLPSGMDLDPMTGQLLGTPSPSGSYLFVVRATDGVGAAAYRAVHLEVGQAQSVTLLPVSMTPYAGKIGEAYTFTLTATGGTVPYLWSIHEGALPPGLSLNGATGEISGTPLEAGSWSATIQVADASVAAQSTTFDVAMSVAAEPQVQGATETAGGGGGGGCGCVGLEALLLLGILGLRRRHRRK